MAISPADGPAQTPGASVFSRVVRVARTGSTNADVAHALQAGRGAQWPHLAVLVTEHQAAGRGRAGRGWQTPAGTSLTASVVLRPDVPLGRWSWLGLVGGLAVARAVAERTDLDAAVKWPNDVLLRHAGDQDVPGWGRDRKIAGVLVEVALPPPGESAPAAILGLGVNVHQRPEELPVPWATSLRAAGADAGQRDPGALLEAVGRHLAGILTGWQAAGGDAAVSGVAGAVAARCVTLGRIVRVALPGGGEVVGTATGLGDDGALVLRPAAGPDLVITAGDVDHIRTING